MLLDLDAITSTVPMRCSSKHVKSSVVGNAPQGPQGPQASATDVINQLLSAVQMATRQPSTSAQSGTLHVVSDAAGAAHPPLGDVPQEVPPPAVQPAAATATLAPAPEAQYGPHGDDAAAVLQQLENLAAGTTGKALHAAAKKAAKKKPAAATVDAPPVRKKPAGARVCKKPAGRHRPALGCSKCRWLKNGCTECKVKARLL